MLQLGIIADDFTGASDIASFLVENGLRTVQMNGIPQRPLPDGVDAVVISLKSRSNPVNEAVAQSLAALDWLRAQDCRQFYFKYCSTFDSTAQGNIGPVTDALLDALGADFTVISPALPVNGRTIFNGYLFVGDVLLNESGMRNHPITPMTDASLIRLMDAQSRGKTGLVACPDVAQGAARVRERFAELRRDGYRYAVVDSVDNAQLAVLAEACADLKLLTGGSGLGAYVAARLSGGKKGSELKAIQQRFGVEKASHAIEQTFAALAVKLKAHGVRNFINAGGETSSIVVQQLGIDGFHIGRQIAPGVPWLRVLDGDIYLALKSGNFGSEDFFAHAQGMFA